MRTRFAILSLCLGFFAARAHGEVVLPCLFSDHMVLQAQAHVPFWGVAAAGEQVSVNVAGVEAATRADDAGKWKVELDLHAKSGGPYVLDIQAGNKIVIHDVLVGEVWVAGGQSNMEFTLDNSTGAAQEITSSSNNELREFKVAKVGSTKPLASCRGQWVSASPATSGKFTAVGYYYAKELQHVLKTPVGLISSNYGGSQIEAWISQSALRGLPGIEPVVDAEIAAADSYPDRLATYRREYSAWQQRYHREDLPGKDRKKLAQMSTGTDGWEPVTLAGAYTEPSLKDGGTIWLKRTVEVKADQVGSYITLIVGSVHEFDEVFWDGVSFGHTTADSTTAVNDLLHTGTIRRYDVPASMVRQGIATIAIRIFNPVGPPSVEKMAGSADFGAFGNGTWLERIESREPQLDPEAKATFPPYPVLPAAERSIPTNLFNGMISPLLPYAIRGVIWFQGEANVARAFQYRTLFPAMIEDWRRQWGEGDFAFLFCQLANLYAKDKLPAESNLAELREAQSMALALPNTGQAITIDLGEESDVHFRDKKTVGLRLSRIALAKTYGLKGTFSGPVYASSQVEGSSMRIRYLYTDGGLKAVALPAAYRHKSTQTVTYPLVRNSPSSELEGFEICGPDHKFVWADARIDGASVVVSSPKVANPVAVRYAWANNPTVNLYNQFNLPAASFRTDDFPARTRNAHY